MSLIGAEVDMERPSTPLGSHSSGSEDAHPSVSPKRGAEALFLDDLETQQISALALAQQIHARYSTSTLGGASTVATQDYATAVGDSDMGDDDDESSDALLLLTPSYLELNEDSPFGKDALVHSREPEDFNESYQDSNMTEKPVDAAEKVYDTAKSVWGWGKGVMVLSPFLGLAEGVASKVVSMAGSSLDEVDDSVNSRLASLDGKYLNPAIEKLVTLLMGTFSKTEEIFKPFLMAILKPVGLIKSDAETPELTTKPPALTTAK